MKNMIKLFGVLGIIISVGLTSHMKAQENNVIKEVKISGNDGFGELRNLVMQNFDFTNPNLTEGKINSEVKFEVSENGKIEHVTVNGDCKYVNKEIQEVMTHLLYRFADSSKMNAVYVLPITVFIASR
ncbi:hypothetical protein CBW16_02840 [Flavobacteriaceae bacterium JJC]|nr:hypothetical protein CBW16_02840 [Flavobacteriaceae bacterium JJC]